MRSRVISLLLAGLLIQAGGAAAAVHTNVPDAVVPEQKYFFYMHGAWIERFGLNRSHPRHGPYEYKRIVQIIGEKGFEVISEVRTGDVWEPGYATGIANQVLFLLERGVPPGNITVAGHSKGGKMALLIASLVGEPRVNYVILAGCGRPGSEFRRGYQKFLRERAQNLRGRILSLYDTADREAGSCREALQQAADAETREIVLLTGRGHGLFYSPDPIWVDKMFEWID